jgi:hypothetical protein
LLLLLLHGLTSGTAASLHADLHHMLLLVLLVLVLGFHRHCVLVLGRGK